MDEFFSTIFGDQVGHLRLSFLDRPTGKMSYRYIHKIDVTEAPEIVNAASERYDVYFTPTLFKTAGKGEKDNVTDDVTCLWSDLDTCDPSKLKLEPSLVWESSPGRWQALWLLENPIPKREAEDLSRRIAYEHADQGADKSGWDLTQLLRVPGTPNHKYSNKPLVGQPVVKRLRYRPSDFTKAYGEPVPTTNDDRLMGTVTELPDFEQLPTGGYVAAAIEDILTELPKVQGDRSNRNWWLMCRLAEIGCSLGQIRMVTQHYAPALDKNSENTGWLDADLIRFIEKPKGWQQHRKQETPKPAELVSTNSRLVNGEDFLFGDLEDSVPLWGTYAIPMWAKGESLMLFGPPGVGKTTLAHLLTFARLGLFPGVFNWSVTDDGGNVLYLAMDRPAQIGRAMRRLVKPEQRDVLGKRLTVWRGPLPIDICKNRDWLPDFAEEQGATTIVVDSLKDAVPNPSDEVAAGGYNLARQETLARGIEWIEIHHNRKGNGENRAPNTLDDVYGNRWLTAGAGSVLCLWGNAGDVVVKLSQIKSPAEMMLPMEVALNTQTGVMAPHDHIDLPTLLAMGGSQGLTVVEVAKAMYTVENPTKNQKENVRVRLNRMTKADPPTASKVGERYRAA